MARSSVSFAQALGQSRTGDIWLFRGRTPADRAIRLATNAPINHVGMAVVLDDMDPMIWHAELGKALPDVYTGQHHRGVQLHLLADAVRQWHDRYEQHVFWRQLHADVTQEMEEALLVTIARMVGTPFPSTASLVSRWLRGRVRSETSLETVYCAELVATTYEAMGLLGPDRPENWYDPGAFWSGDDLELRRGAVLGGEIEVLVPTA